MSGLSKKIKLLSAAFLFPAITLAAPDEQLLGKAEGYPACPPSQGPSCLVGFWSAMDRFGPSHLVAKGVAVRPLKRAPAEPDLALDAFLAQNRNTGLLILQGDTILAERYQYGRKAEDRFASASMAKTVLAMLIGIAVAEKKIRSLEMTAVQFVPELKGHPYGDTSLRHLLTMSSGVKFDESGDDPSAPGSDSAILLANTVQLKGKGGALSVAAFTRRLRPAGEKFQYSSGESEVLGLVLRNAVDQPLADYLSDKIWRPMGAESDASWLVDPAGFETGYCCLNATLRDYARFGLLLANYGARDGRQIIPEQWVRAATTAQAPHLMVGTATRYNGYGYQTWLIHPGAPQFAAFGARGQAIFVDAGRKIVVVHTAVHEYRRDTDARREQFALWDNILAKLPNR
jgi:CubicO group peptidase (beta-lactamase class C family)